MSLPENGSPLPVTPAQPRRTRGRREMLLAGLGVALVAVLVVLDWNGLVASVHLRRLRASPDYLLSIVERPEGTPERPAIREWLAERRGREAFFRVFLGEVHARLPLATTARLGGTGLLGLGSRDGLWFRYDEESSGLNVRLSPFQLKGSLPRLIALKQFFPLLGS